MTAFRTRFAPSPTGHLHLGHAFSAMTAFEAARAAGGEMLLRIEDIDQTRCKPEFETSIIDDLAWLGLRWPGPIRRQSDHMEDYARALEMLIARGLVYRCFKTRSEILADIARAPHFDADGPEGPVYIGAPLDAGEEDARLAAGEPFAWRLSMARAREILGAEFDELSFDAEEIAPPHAKTTTKATPGIFGDVILGRKDSGASYHLASVHDDALQAVTHVVRGEDLAAAAHLHALLQALFDWPRPIYRHHRLVRDESGRRLAKRDKAATLRSLRKAGASPAEIRSRLGVIG